MLEKNKRQVLTEKTKLEKNRCEYIITRKDNEIKQLKSEIKGLKELNILNEAIICVLTSKGIFPKIISKKAIRNFLKSNSKLIVKCGKDAYKLTVQRERE